jgi:hypothetical protein
MAKISFTSLTVITLLLIAVLAEAQSPLQL